MVTATGPRRTDSSAPTFPVLHDKVAVVTGAAMGMGAATAELFAQAGARVVVADFDDDAGRDVVADIQRAGGTAHFHQVDVSDSTQVHGLIAATAAQYGRLDIAVNNAAIRPDNKPLAELDEEHWDRVIAVNLKGVALCLKWELQQMIRQGGHGSIINISSVSGIRPQATAPAYVAAKHGVIGLTKVAAVENGHLNIRVNAVAPGAIDTPMLQGGLARTNRTGDDVAPQFSLFNRLGEPREIAQASLWLASDHSSYVTGATIPVDAGYTNR